MPNSLKRKVIFLNYIPSPYRVDFFNELNKFCDLTVVFYYPTMLNAPWENFDKKKMFRHFFLFENQSFIKGIYHHFKFLYKYRKETIVIGGYAMKVEILTIFFLKLLNIDFILNSDGGFVTKGFFKTALKKILIQSATYYLSSGSNTSKTLQYYGAKSTAIYEYHFSSIFKSEVIEKVIPINEKNTLRKELNLDLSIIYLIFVGQLIHRKGVDTLLHSLEFLKNDSIEILIIGSGSEQENLLKIVNNKKVSNKVHFLGKLSKEFVLKYLKVSDLFIFPSREDIWGLVLNEAIANGLPVISANRVGSAYSLIKSGENGSIIEVDNPFELAREINNIVKQDLGFMKNKSLAISKKFTIEQMVEDHLVFFKKISN